MFEFFHKKYCVISLVLIAVLVNGCKTAPPPAPEKSILLSPIQIEPKSLKTTIAIPSIENAIINYSDPNGLFISILDQLDNVINNDFKQNGRFGIIEQNKIEFFETQRQEKNLPLIDQLDEADLILYILATSWNEKESYLICGCYLVAVKTNQVIERFEYKFNYEINDKKINFNEDQIFNLDLDLIKKYPRLQGNIITTNNTNVRVKLVNKDKVFIGQEAIAYKSLPSKDPKYEAYEHSFIPVMELSITEILEDSVVFEIISGGNSATNLDTNDFIVMK